MLSTIVEAFAVGILLGGSAVFAQGLDTSSADSIKAYSADLAQHLVSQYHGNETGEIPGILNDEYWWVGGAMFDALIQYWHLTGDSQYNSITSQALLFQVGPQDNYMPTNQTSTLGNDHQDFWALAAMSAAENNFPLGPEGSPSWLSLAKNVFNTQVLRWDTTTCGGGIRWQIFAFNSGYDYKTSISNGALFQLSSRLARYTGNSTYSDWAEKIYDWSVSANFVAAETGYVYDGASSSSNCSSLNHIQFSYVAGTYLTGAAHMYNLTASSKWKTALDTLLNGTDIFFPDGILTEISCEEVGTCNSDIMVMKGKLAHWMGATMQLAPYTTSTILPKLTSSAKAAATVCGIAGLNCDYAWSSDFEGGQVNEDIGTQLSALSVVQALLVLDASSPNTGSEISTSTNSTSTTTALQGTTSSTSSPTGTSPASSSVVTGAASLKYATSGLVGLLASLGALVIAVF